MKKLKLIAAIVFVTVAVNVTAQNKIDTPTQTSLKETQVNKEEKENSKNQLNLTPEQKKQIKEIKSKRATEKRELKAKLRSLQIAERIEINNVLTEEQRAIKRRKKAIQGIKK